MTETLILDESAVSEIEAQLNSGSLLLPLRVEHWHMSLNSGGGWYIKNASDRIVMTVAFVPAEIETGKPANDGNAPARHTAALLNSIPALCATVKHLRAENERLRGQLGVGAYRDTEVARLNDRVIALQSQLELLRAENERLNEAAERDRKHLNAKQSLLAGTQARLAQVKRERDELSTEMETCHAMLDQFYSEDPAMTSGDTLEQRLKLHLDELRPVITDGDVNGG